MGTKGQASKDPDLVNYATEFKLRCERRLGEMLVDETHRGGDPKTGQGRRGTTLADLNATRNLSARAQRIASSIPTCPPGEDLGKLSLGQVNILKLLKKGLKNRGCPTCSGDTIAII